MLLVVRFCVKSVAFLLGIEKSRKLKLGRLEIFRLFAFIVGLCATSY